MARPFLFVAVVFTMVATASAQSTSPPQHPAASSPLGTGTKEEQTACAPDVVKYCNHELDVDVSDTVAIVGCLQRNRQQITVACRTVLTNHGQ